MDDGRGDEDALWLCPRIGCAHLARLKPVPGESVRDLPERGRLRVGFYPRQVSQSLQDAMRQFYKVFYWLDLTDEQVSTLLAAATLKRRDDMKMSARNILKGKIVDVTKGATTAHVKIDVGGIVVTSSITNAAVDELKLAPGKDAYAVIKASDVMIGTD